MNLLSEPKCLDDRPHEYGPPVRFPLGRRADNPERVERSCVRCGATQVRWPAVWRFPEQTYWRRDP